LLPAVDAATAEGVLRRVSIFARLDDAAFGELLKAGRPATYASGEVVVRQGQPGTSMFVIVRGGAVVVLEPSGQEVARLQEGAFFGEMSLLTGAPRTATVRATRDTDVLEITADAFRTFVLANPAALETVSLAASTRAAELEQLRSSGGSTPVQEPPATFVNRVRRFLRLAG
jgi:CRP-like cAMP-binding protein